VSVVAFPGPADRASLAAAVDRYLDSVQTATTRASYAETLARLVDVAGAGRRADAEAFAAVMASWDDAGSARRPGRPGRRTGSGRPQAAVAGSAPGRRVGALPPTHRVWTPADLHRNRLNVRSGSDAGPPRTYHRRVTAVSVVPRGPTTKTPAGRGPRLPGTSGDPRVCGWRSACRLAPTW
jgi:hypothetical protein